VSAAIHSQADVGALGYLVGRKVKNKVPFFRFREWEARDDDLKTLGAAMAASGAVALYHVAETTPEAKARDMVAPDAERVVVDSLGSAYHALDGSMGAVDFVSLGCPHASLAELETIATYLDGRRTTTALWITLARATREAAEKMGLVGRLEAAGARVVADTCMVVAPVASLGFRSMATNSAKMAVYAPAHSGLSVRFGTTEQCLETALSGRWTAA
jgi:predicted aconitase